MSDVVFTNVRILDGTGQNLTNGTKGGTLTVYDHEDFQHLDPGQAYFSLDYEVIYATQSTLYFFPPNSSTTRSWVTLPATAMMIRGGTYSAPKYVETASRP